MFSSRVPMMTMSALRCSASSTIVSAGYPTAVDNRHVSPLLEALASGVQLLHMALQRVGRVDPARASGARTDGGYAGDHEL